MTLFCKAVPRFTVNRARGGQVLSGERVPREDRTATPPLAIFLSVEEGVGSGSDLVSEAHGGDPAAWWGCVASCVMDAQRGKSNCDEESEMNFATFSAVGATGTHFVTTGGQMPVAKLQQNVSNNGNTLSQVVGMVGGLGEGVQYVRALEGGGLAPQPHLISVPIALPGAKPGDPQPTVQIQVLSPNLTLQPQQQPKYQMQIPIQGFQQGGAVLTVAYSPEAGDPAGIQLVGQSGLPEGLQVLTALPQEMQLIQPAQAQSQDTKDQIPQHQVFITPNQQIIINGPEDNKALNNNTSNNNNNAVMHNIIIKEECDDNMNDDESSQGTEASDSIPWQMSSSSQQDLIKYLNTLPPQLLFQQTQALPVSLQQFLRLNPSKGEPEPEADAEPDSERKDDTITTAVLGEDGTLRITKKKKKYKKKPPRPARPKPGQVVIATAADGSPVYCCPECTMAYPDKEQLEMHLIVHKIERRFICGICGAGLKRKEHLERHKMGHNPERPYVCGVCRKGFKRREHLNLHTVIHSGVKTEMCGECGKGFYRKDHLRKHTRSHESKRARDEAGQEPDVKPAPATLMPEITIHVPTSANMQVPVQINIPTHMVSALSSTPALDTQAQLDQLLAHHS